LLFTGKRRKGLSAASYNVRLLFTGKRQKGLSAASYNVRLLFTGKRRKGLSAASYNVDKNKEETDSPTDDGTRLVLSGGEGYVDFRIGEALSLTV